MRLNEINGGNLLVLKEVEYRLHLTPAPDDQEMYGQENAAPFEGETLQFSRIPFSQYLPNNPSNLIGRSIN